jgi:polysaccharide pyruvyl transferase WcaK-like protein
MLALLEKHFPEAKITLWPHKPLTEAATALLMQRFPLLQIVEGNLSPEGEASNSELTRVLDEADFLLHSSGPAMLDWDRAEAFHRRTGRPFGVYGVTYGLYGIPERETLSRTRFTYFRDSVSLERAKGEGVNAPITEWSPDVAFATDLRDDARADAFLRANGLQEGQFLCCISRLRNTPFWEMAEHKTPFDPVKHARNEAMKAHDHAPLIEAVTAVTRQTNMKVLICPEDNSQMQISHDNLLAHLPADVRERVVWRDSFWLPDEALSVYRRSAGLFGHEMHSPIMCIGNGIPAIVCRWAEQSSKGFMWRDIGLGEWLFDFDDEGDLPRLAPAVLAMAQDPAAAIVKAERARDFVFNRYAQTMNVVREEVLAARAAATRDAESEVNAALPLAK